MVITEMPPVIFKNSFQGNAELLKLMWRAKQGLWRGLAKVLWAIPQCSKPVYPDSEAAGLLVDFEWR